MDFAGWMSRKKSSRTSALFVKHKWMRRWYVLVLDNGGVLEEYSDTSRFELCTTWQISRVISIRKEKKYDRLSLLLDDDLAVIFKTESMEDRDLWYEALLALKLGKVKKYPIQRHWGDLPLNRESTSHYQQEEESHQNSPPLIPTSSPLATERKISNNSELDFSTGVVSKTSDPPFTLRTSNLRLNPRTSQNLMDSQHLFMGKARNIALSISRDTEASTKKKNAAPAAHVNPRNVVVPILVGDTGHLPALHPLQFIKTPAEQQKLGKVLEEEIPHVLLENVQHIVELMYKVVIPKAHTDVVIQGESTDKMYVVDAGSEVGIYTQDFINLPPEFDHLKRGWECFGVWSVIYNQPGPFTMRTHVDNCTLWVLERGKLLDLLTNEQKRLVSKKARLLDHVWLLAKYLDATLLDQLADSMEFEEYALNDVLVRKGKLVSKLFIVSEGTAQFGRNHLLQRFDVFGEWALLDPDNVAEEDLVCTSQNLVVLTLNIREVEEVVGPIKLYVIKKFSPDFLLDVDNFDAEFSRIISQDRQTLNVGQAATIVKQRFTNRTLSQGGGGRETESSKRGDEAEGEEEGEGKHNLDQAFDYDIISPLRPELDLDEFQFVSLLGKGQFGVVHRAIFLPTREEFAIKVMRGAVITLNGWEKMVEQERDAMCELTRKFQSPFLLHLFHYTGDFKNCYLVIELCTGGNLFDLRKRFEPCLSLAHLQFYVACTVCALEVMHSINIVHRDVKPENSFLTQAGVLKLADFGIAKKTLRTFTFCGTPEYMAPEILLNLGHGHGVDYWAMGILLFEVACGFTPFSGFEPSEIYEKTLAYGETLHMDFPDSRLLSEECKALVLDLLHPKKNKRLGVRYPGVQGIKSHAFFNAFDWEAFQHSRLSSPALPAELLSAPVLGDTSKYDAKLNFAPDDSTGWSQRF